MHSTEPRCTAYTAVLVSPLVGRMRVENKLKLLAIASKTKPSYTRPCHACFLRIRLGLAREGGGGVYVARAGSVG